MTAILFLDFDGVLHPEPCHDSPLFCRMPLLERALAALPQVRVVVSSSWRHGRSLDDLRALFPESLQPRIVGFTPTFKDFAHEVPEALKRFPREAECLRWLRDNGELGTAWVALDDAPWMFTPLCPHLVETDSTTGLQDNEVEALLKRVRRFGSVDVHLP